MNSCSKPLAIKTTMKIRKNNKLILILLLLIGILVWAQVIIQLFRNTEVSQINHDYDSQPAVGEQFPIGLWESDTAFIVKIDQLNNPFIPDQKIIKRPRQIESREPIPPVVPPPSLKYLGYIADENEPFALIQMPDEKSVILKEGDYIQEFYVKSVTMDSMIIGTKKLRYTYFLIGE